MRSVIKYLVLVGLAVSAAMQTTCSGEKAPPPSASEVVGTSKQALSLLTYTLGTHGINSLTYDGHALVTADSFIPQTAYFLQPDGTVRQAFDPSATYTRNGNSFTFVSNWGTMFATYSQAGDSVVVDFGTYNPNTTDTLLQSETAIVAELVSPAPAQSAVQVWNFAVDQFAPQDGTTQGYPQASGSTGALPLTAWDFGTFFEAVTADPALGPGGTAQPAHDTAVLFHCNIPNADGCWPRVAVKDIGPGETKTRRFYLRFAPSGTSPYTLNADIFEKYNAAKPQQLQWDDRRPILRDIDLANSVIHSAPSNPRRYQTDKDLRTDAGKAAFRADLLTRADTMIGHMNAVGAQGIVTGSIEGLEGPYTGDATPVASIYTGDPTRVALAPEMEYQVDGVATVDAYMQKFTDAGFRVGNFLRPQGLKNVPREIGTQFKPSVDGTIRALRVYSSHLEANAIHTARLWRDSDGVSVGGPYTWTYGSTTGWVELDIPDVAVTAGTEYTVTVSTATDGGAYPVLPGTDAFLTNGGGHLSYRNISVTTVSMGTRPTDILVGAVNAMRDLEFVPGAGGATETLFGSSAVPTDAYTTLIHYDIADPAQRLIELIAYSNERWGSSVFFVDSTAVNLTTYPINGEIEPFGVPPVPLSSDFFKRVEEAFPNVLIMPANQVSNDYPYTAPYDDGIAKTVQKVTAQWPGAFSAFRTRSTNPNLLSGYVAGAQHGDIYLFAAGASDENWLNSVYQQAGHPPTARITSPADGTNIAAGSSLTITASASDPDGSVSTVEFYDSTVENGRILLGQSTTSPYSFTSNNVPLGRHVLSARAIDNAGLEMWSRQIVVTASHVADVATVGTHGLAYSYYTGTWTSLPDFSALTPAATGTIANFNLSANPSRAADHFGYVFSGYIYVPTGGTYTFYCLADDSCNLSIGNTQVVDNDKGLRMIEQSGSIDLQAGFHAITVKYFDDTGTDGLGVGYRGPNVAKQPIPDTVLYNACTDIGTCRGPGDGCTSDAECAADQVCGVNNGAFFGRPRGTRVCWKPECLTDPVGTGCGSSTNPCGTNCAGVTECDSTNPASTCPFGEVCKQRLGVLFNAPFIDACVDVRCPSNDPALCGQSDSICGASCVCTPNCASATCDNSLDGCGGQCPGVCGTNGTGCTDDVNCQPGFACILGAGGTHICKPADCAFHVLAPPLCGVPGAHCGDVCPACTPRCDGRTCGPDPNCGQSCGTCAAGSYCASNGTCVTPTARPPLQVPDGHGGTKPVPELGSPPTSLVGAVPGAFSVTEEGIAQYTVPIDVPPGRAGIQPALSLMYHGSRNNEDAGVGWRLEGLSQITRCPHAQALDKYTGPIRNDSTDVFCIDGKRLEAVKGVTTGTVGKYGDNGTEYRTLIDSFARVISYHDATGGIQLDLPPGVVPVPRAEQGPDSFKVWTKEGRILTYGATRDSLVLSTAGTRFAWLLNRVEDHVGNTMNITYTNVLANPSAVMASGFPNAVRPSVISYTGHITAGQETPGNREVHFTYEPRVDPLLSFRQGGVTMASDERLSRITTFIAGTPVKNYRLQYGDKTYSQIESIYECAKDSVSECKPPTRFTYNEIVEPFSFGPGGGPDIGAAAQLDTNGDGIVDFLSTQIKVGDVAANPTLEALQIEADVGVAVGSAFLGPAGIGVDLIWGLLEGPFFGLFADEPTVTILRTMNISTGNRNGPLLAINNVQGIPCGDNTQAPTFILDYNGDGKDDLAVLCNERQLHIALSRGDGNFDDSSVLALPAVPQPPRSASIRVPHPLLFDVDGDSLQDLVSCADQFTLQVRRRMGSDQGFDDLHPITLTTVESPAPPHGGPFRPRLAFCGNPSPTHRVVDIDGDGKPDLLVRGDDGWAVLRYSVLKPCPDPVGSECPQLAFEPVQFPDVGYSAKGANPNGGAVLSLADLNGDGLADIWTVDGNKATVWLNTGGKRFLTRNLVRPQPALQALPSNGVQYTYQRTAVLDYDGDGRLDLLENWLLPHQNEINVALFPNSSVTAFDSQRAHFLWPDPNMKGEETFFNVGDVDGDGAMDLIGWGFFYGPKSHRLLLKSVTDGLGNFTNIDYDGGAYHTDERCAATKWPEKCLPHITSLVSSDSEGFTDATGTPVSERGHTYQYLNARMNLTGHGWLGFDQRIVKGNDSGHDQTVVTDYEPVARYDLNGQAIDSAAPPYIYPLAGLPHVVRIADGLVSRDPGFICTVHACDPPPLQTATFYRLTRIENDWGVQLSAYGRPFPVVSSRDTSTYDKALETVAPPPPLNEDGALLLSDCFVSNVVVDAFGNTTHSDEICQNEEGESNAEETIMDQPTFETDVANWLAFNPTEIRITSTRSDETQTQSWGLQYQNGMLFTATRAPGNTAQQHKTTYLRDAFGNPYQITENVLSGEHSRTTTITYDSDNVYPTTVTNAVDQTNQTSLVSFDPRFGTPLTAADPNGIFVQRVYDDFGRLAETGGPDGTAIVTLSASAIKASDTAAGHIEPRIDVTIDRRGLQNSIAGHVVTQYDSYGRVVRTASAGFAGANVVEERSYDSLGRLHGITLPHQDNVSSSLHDTYSYDDLGRLTQVDHSGDGSSKKFQYATIPTLVSSGQQWLSDLACSGFFFPYCAAVGVTLSIDEEGRKNVVVTDYRGLVLRSIDGENVEQTQHTAKYAYGAFNRLIETKDNLDNATEFFYDEYGRPFKTIDPNTGTSTLGFNGYDEVVSSQRPSGLPRQYRYDDLGRMISAGDSSGSAQWIYDQGVNGIGRLSETISQPLLSARTQHVRYSYESPPSVPTGTNRGFVSTIDYVLDGVSNSIGLDYDDAGRTQRIHYPNTGGGTPIVAQYRYDTAAGILVGLDEVGSSATRPIWQLTDSIQGYLVGHETFGNGAVTAYDYDPGRRWVKSIHSTLGNHAQTLDYTHYMNGLMKDRTTPGLTRTYSYDRLNRLSSTLDQPSTGNSVSTSYTYDPIGNLTGRGATTYTFDPVRPHLLATAGGNSYQYDANGVLNLRGGPDVPRGIQTIDSAPFDLPLRIKGGPGGSVSETDFDYTADEERVVQADATGTRYYAGDLYERLANNSGGSALEERFKLYLGSRQVAEIVRQGGSDNTLFFHADAIGTVSAISDGSGAWSTQEFDPFGSPVSATNPALTRAGFTGQMHDRDLGFIDMKGRIYDPIAARFTSADPIMQAPFFSQGLNRYAYAFNDPVNHVDPSGFDTYLGEIGGAYTFSDFAISGGAGYTASGSAVFPSAGGAGGAGAALGAGLLGAGLDVGSKLIFGGYSQWDAHPGGTYNASSGVRAATSSGAGQGSTNATAQSGGVAQVTPRSGCPGQGFCHDPPSEVHFEPLSAEQVLDFILSGLESPVNAAGPGDITYDRTPTLVFMVSVASLVGGPKLAGAGRLATKTERIAEHLTQRDLSAASREAAGHVVAVKPSGVPFNHLLEVREAQQGLLNRIDAINRLLSRPTLDAAERAQLENELSHASRLLDYSERYLPR
jgi:RHS repeat-associated protein